MFPRGAWIPKKLPGLVLDFDMAMGVSKTGDDITYVVDQGEKGNNLEAVGTPKYVASAINGWPGVQCANGSYLRNTAGRLFDQNSARHVFAVLKPLSGAGGFASGGVVLSNPYTTTQTLNNSSPGLMFARATNNWASLEGPTSYGKYNAADIAGSAHIVDISGSSGTGANKVRFSDNGTYNSVTSSQGVDYKAGENAANGFSIGSPIWTGYGSWFFSGYIARILVYSIALDTIGASAVRHYLSNLYGGISVSG